MEIDDLSNVVERTTGHAPPTWVLDLLMTSMDADGDGLLSNTEVWTWANDRGLDVPPHLLASETPEPEPQAEPEPVPQPEPEPQPEWQESPGPKPIQVQPHERPTPQPVRTQPVPRPITAVAATQSTLGGLLDAFSQNLRGDEIQAIVDANTDVFHVSGTVNGNKATLLGEAGWRNGRTLTVTTDLGEIDVQIPGESATDLKHVDHHVHLHGWNRGLSRAVFRLA